MLKTTITLTGRSQNDLELALQEALRVVEAGNTSGTNRNDTGSFTFETTGEDEYDLLERRGFTWDGEAWSKGEQSALTYDQALELSEKS